MTPGEDDSEVVPPFNAFSGSGNVSVMSWFLLFYWKCLSKVDTGILAWIIMNKGHFGNDHFVHYS